MYKRKPKLFEGLREGDLKDQISNTFSIDHYKSKMGNDKDIVVLGFRLEDKFPATDLMEFIEKGYNFILDADMSTGEEQDGKYQVFVEIERTKKLPGQLRSLIDGVSQLCDNYDWKFKYQKLGLLEFNEKTIMENVPLDDKEYTQKMLEIQEQAVKEFFNQGATEVVLDETNTIIASRPYSGSIAMDLIAIGDYEEIKNQIPGAIQLDEASRSQVSFLEKYLGNYDINRINGKFLIRNGTRAVIINKDHW
jgi:predicted PolB exonuclease-like 3'-5' exonuclease